jgi:pyruvate/2-oxoglutarate dehydrogenase complex dihydrolipoamide dehydrogenase (E3) component
MIVVVESPGGGPFGASFQAALAAATGQKATLVRGEPVAIRGSSRVKAVVVRDASGKEHELAADAVLVDAPRSPAYELAEQAGARVAREARGYVVRTDAGRIAKGVYATGELTGTLLDATAIDAEAASLAANIAGD